MFIISFFDLSKSAVLITICLHFKGKYELFTNCSSVTLFYLVMAVYCDCCYPFWREKLRNRFPTRPAAVISDCDRGQMKWVTILVIYRYIKV